MNYFIFACLLGCAFAAPGYQPPYGGVGIGSGGGGSGLVGGGGSITCGPDQLNDGTGRCVVADVTRNVFVYASPKLPVSYGLPPPIPKPKLEYNVVFVRTPEAPHAPDPIVVPPPQQRTIVYVLTRNGQLDQKVIEVPGNPSLPPEVLYVNYDEGDNLDLAGISLSDVLSRSAQQGRVISGIGVGGGIGGIGGPGGVGGLGGGIGGGVYGH